MSKERLLAYTDAVVAIIITIMVLELKIPEWHERIDLRKTSPVFFGYLMSFVFISIYRNNHHHLFHAVKYINGKILRSNNILLFFLSLIPFTTAWMTESNFAHVPVMLYGIYLLLCVVSYTIITKHLLKLEWEDSILAKAVWDDQKWKISLALYIFGVLIANFYPIVALASYAIVSVIWLLPDKRIEKLIQNEEKI